MNKLPYEQALARIRAEYQEMPGMRLTPEQVERLCGVDCSVCAEVLDALVKAKFLSLRRDGSYRRVAAGSPSRVRITQAHGNASMRSPASRRTG
jgi:hypothetical protein